MGKKRWGGLLLALLLVLAGCVPVSMPSDMTITVEQPSGGDGELPELMTRSTYNTACYMEQGGAAFVCGTGGAITMEAGSTLTSGGTLTIDGVTTIGDGGDTVAIDSSDWDISTTGIMTGIGAITSDGTLTANGTLDANSTVTIGDNGDTVAIDSSDWDINATGDMTGIGAITADGAVAQTQVNVAGAGANPWDYTGTLGAMTNGDDFTLFDVNITNANHTGTTNTMQVLDIAGITQDAETTETAILVGAGWDYGLDLDGNAVIIGADGGVTLDETSDDVVALTLGAGTGTASVLVGNAKVGNGVPTQAQDGEDLYVESMLEVDTGAYFDGTVAQTQVNVAGAGANPWDYTGTLGAMTDGDDFTLFDVNITNANHTGTTSTVQAVDIAGITQDAEATETAIKVGAGWDYGLDMDGNAVIIGADGGVTLDETSDDVVALTLGAGAGTASVLVGNFKVGGGVPGVALNGEDAYVTGTFEVDGASQFDGAATIGDGGDTVAINSSDWAINATGVATGLGAVTMDGALTASAGATFSGANKDVTLSADSTGGNKMAVNQFIGVPRITLAGLGQIANGTTNTVITDIGDSETPATDWTAINANTTMSNNTDFFRQGTASLKMAVLATAVAGDGCTNALASGDQNWTDDEGFGFWFYTTKALDAGDLTLRIADATAGGGYTALDVPAATANSWQWLEINVSSANNLKDVITDLSFNLSAAGQAKAVAGAFDVYFDFIVKWDVADEEALPQDIQTDGVLTVMSMTITDANAASANLTEYTHYFTNYQTSTDAIVPITDLSGTGIAYVALIAY